LPDLLQEEFRLPYGTAPYYGPERLLGVRTIRAATCFRWCAAVLLHHGERPFGESETLRGMRRRLWRDPIRRASLSPIIRHGCRKSCCGAWRIEPVWRHPTASQLRSKLAHPNRSS